MDAEANYRHVFPAVTASKPVIVHSHVERSHRKLLGIFVLPSEYNGDWQFELLASPEWLTQVKTGFVEIPFTSVPVRRVPDWFSPSPENYSAWQLQTTSYPNAHLFIEKKPESGNQIRVFIRRD